LERVVKSYHLQNIPTRIHDEIWKIKSDLGYVVELHEVYKLILEIGLRHVKEHWNEFLELKEEKEKLKEKKLKGVEVKAKV
jgi:hypothetical protein